MAASEEDHPNVYGEDIDEDDDDDESEEEDLVLSATIPNPPPEDLDDDDDSSSSAITPPLPPSASQVTVAVPGIHNGNPIHQPPIPPSASGVTVAANSLPDPKRQRVDEVRITALVEEKKPLPTFDESRRLFQRLWTDEDEIELLQGFLDYTTQKGANNPSHHHDTTVFYDQIKSKLQVDFNKNQLVEKLRRLKKKYRNVCSRIDSGKEYVFKSPHDQTTFEISKKIWGGAAGRGGAAIGGEEGGLDDDEGNPSPYPTSVDHNNNGMDINSSERKAAPRPRKRSRGVKIEEPQHQQPQFNKPQFNQQPQLTAATPTATSITNLIEETVRSCLSPLLKELLHNAMNGPSGSLGFAGMVALNPMPLNFSALNFTGGGRCGGDTMDNRWRKQQILELEVYSKRLELVQEQIKSALQDLRSAGG